MESHSQLLQTHFTRFLPILFSFLLSPFSFFFTIFCVNLDGIWGPDQANQSELPRDFLGISLADEPSKYYFVIRSQRIVVEADSSIQLIMEKLQSYKSKVALYFEGFQYQLGDFRLRVGKVVPTHSENVRGIVMEVAIIKLHLVHAFYSQMKMQRLCVCVFIQICLCQYRCFLQRVLVMDAGSCVQC